MNKINRTMGQSWGRITKLFVVLLLTGLFAGLQSGGSVGASTPEDISTAIDQAVSTAPAEYQVTGEKIVVEPAGKASWQDMLDYEANNPVEPATPRVVPYMPIPSQELSGVEDVTTDISLETPTSDPLAPPGTVNSFLGLGDNNTSIPPDTMGAVGPNHLMVMLNTQVRIQTKTGGTISTVTLDTFWTSGTGLSGDPFDPKVVYDSLSDRWIATIDADGGLATSAVWFAISDTNDPTGNWTFYTFDADSTDTYWADYPGFGVNNTWIAITNNMFTNAGNLFSGAKLWVMDKALALAGGPLTTMIFARGFDAAGSRDGSTLQPAVTFDASESTLYIVDGNRWSSGGVGFLRLSQITGTGPAPSWSVVPGSILQPGSGQFLTTETYNLTQVDADQFGTTTLVNTNNPRLLNAVLRNGRIWTTHSGGYPRVAAADRTIAVWYEINPASAASPIVQSGTVDNGAGTHYFFPSITANANNDAALGFSYSDGTQFVEAAYTGRESTDTLGTMGAVTTCKAGESAYSKFFSGTRNRWGDYSATVVDPTDDLTFWTLQEYAETNVGTGVNDGRWGTWWCRAQIGNEWQGDDVMTPTAWNEPNNWSSGAVPTSTTDAVIPANPSGSNFPIITAAADVRNLTIAVGATVDLGSNTLTVFGNFDNSGSFSSSGGMVNFNGGTTQNLTANAATTFTNLTVSSGTTLVETAAADNVTVSGTLTNNGTIRKSQLSLVSGSTTFGLTGASINNASLYTYTLQVDRVGAAHPDENDAGGGAAILDTYYTLTLEPGGPSYSMEVCLGYTDVELSGATEASLRLCRWTGSEWACPDRSGSSNVGTNTVCAANVDTFSDWTIGEVGPTTVTLTNLDAQAGVPEPQITLLVLLTLLVASGLTAVGLKRRTQV